LNHTVLDRSVLIYWVSVFYNLVFIFDHDRHGSGGWKKKNKCKSKCGKMPLAQLREKEIIKYTPV